MMLYTQKNKSADWHLNLAILSYLIKKTWQSRTKIKRHQLVLNL